MTVAELNEMTQRAFVDAVGWVFEHSPWVAERAWHKRPFEDLATLHEAMWAEVERASPSEQLALLRAHPDLGTRAGMSDASSGEQAGAGLDRLSRDDFERLTRLNATYRERHGFPFLFAVKGSTSAEIIDALERRVARTQAEERAEALTHVSRIARFRLEDLFGSI
jgi:2-oxo-4-hydroxy-4-carboxy-5-ureidoimidazoline decarboxylase